MPFSTVPLQRRENLAEIPGDIADCTLPLTLPPATETAGEPQASRSGSGSRILLGRDQTRQQLRTALSSPHRATSNSDRSDAVPASDLARSDADRLRNAPSPWRIRAATLDQVIDATLGPRAARFDRMISTEIELAGSGHVVWGSKPMWWIHDVCYAALGELACRIDLKPNYAWVGPHATNPAVNGGNRGRFLVNRFNLGKLLARHPVYFARIVESLEPTVDNLMAALQQRTASGIDNIDHCLLGVLLGYGMDNAQQFNAARQREAGHKSDFLVGPQDRPVATSIFLEEAIPVQQGFPRRPSIGAIPAFAMWKSDESTALVEQYVNESLDIDAIFLRDAWAAPNPTRAVSRAFLAELFDVQAASHPAGRMYSE